MDRSYLFAPGHNPKLLDRVFTAGADAVMLDLEDAVAPEAKGTARRMVRGVLARSTPVPAWVRVNAARSDWCAADLDAVAEQAVPLLAGRGLLRDGSASGSLRARFGLSRPVAEIRS